MKLSFTNLQIVNFRSFQTEQRLELDQFDAGLHFVKGINKLEPRLGSNGAGKSSLFSSLLWCLYGRTPEGLKGPDIKPWNSKHDLVLVAVDLKLDDHTHLICRTASPNKLTIDAKPATDDDVVKLLSMNYDIFKNTIVMGQGQPLFLDLQPRDKMTLFVDALGLDRWDTASTRASDRVKELDREVAQCDGELLGALASLERTNSLLNSVKKQAQEWEEQRQQHLKTAQKELATLRKQYSKQKELSDKAELDFESAVLDLKSMWADIEKFDNEISSVRTDVAVKQERFKRLERDLYRLQREADNFGRNGKCPMCAQPIKGTVVDQHINELGNKIEELQRAIAKENTKALDKQIAGLMEKRGALTQIAIDKEKLGDTAESKLRLYAPMTAALSEQVTQAERLIDIGENDTNPHHDQVGKLRKEVATLTRNRQTIEVDLAALKRAIERNRFWIRGFKDIRLLVIEDVLQELEITVNASLEAIGLIDWSVHFAIEKETKSGTVQRGLSVTILSPHNQQPVKWESWSGGEGQRLRLIGALALSDVLLNHAGVQPDFEVLDEPTKHLSGEGVEELVEFLAGRAKQLGRKTFFVDHTARESALFASTLTVIKDQNGSRIK